MKSKSARRSAEFMAAVTLLCVFGFIVTLSIVAAVTPSARPALSVVIVGLASAGLILFRENRKAASSLAAGEARAAYIATHDALTDLPNKLMMLDRIQAANDAGTQAVLFCIGLDRFDEVSEALGHRASDEVIAQMASRIVAVSRECDTVARLSDDVFALLWIDAKADKAKTLAAQIVKLLAAPCAVSAGAAFVSCSIGVTFVEAAPDEGSEILRQAQIAMSHARRLGGSQVSLFNPAMDQALKSRKALEAELRMALEAGELEMVYQPQVNRTGAMFGVEALMRWTSKDGPISPSVFIPLAESCGMSEMIGRFALKRAFEDARRWPSLRVAVNVSAAQIRSGRLVATLMELLKQTGVNPRRIELEITEGVLLEDAAETQDVLATIRRLGFSLALDDFGTGYSSLSYLRRFPIDKIKIDKSFVANLGQRPESDAIVKAIVDLASALDIKVIAEGVETKAQSERLNLAGCYEIQGYYFSRPLSVEGVEAMMAGHHRVAA